MRAAERPHAAGAGAVRQGVGARRSRGPARRPTSASTPPRCSARCDAAGRPPATAGRRGRRARRLPLEGVKVADFSWIGVGPITAKALADHGATVVHVESDKPGRPAAPRRPVQGRHRRASTAASSSARSTRRSCRCSSTSSTPIGNDIARRLLAWCDIALDSFTAGTMADARPRLRRRPRAQPGHHHGDDVPARASTGPAAKLAGYGYHAAAVSGFYEITGWDDRPPAGPFNAYTDTDRAALPDDDAARRARPPPAHRRGPVHRPGPDGVGAALPRPRAARRPGVGRQRPPRRQPRPRPRARTTPTRAPATTSGARSPSRPTSSGGRCARALGDAGVGAWTRRSTRPPAAAPQRRADRPRARRVHGRPRAARADGDAAGGRRPGRHGAALERPPAATRSSPTARSSAASSTPRWARCPTRATSSAIRGYDNGPRFPAPCLGEHTYEVLTEVLGLDDDEVADVLASGACG